MQGGLVMAGMEIFAEDGTYTLIDDEGGMTVARWMECDRCHKPTPKAAGNFYDYPDGTWSFDCGCK